MGEARSHNAIVGEAAFEYDSKFYLVKAKIACGAYEIDAALEEIENGSAALGCLMYNVGMTKARVIHSYGSAALYEGEYVWLFFHATEAMAFFLQQDGEMREYDWPEGFTDEDKIVNFLDVVGCINLDSLEWREA